MLVPFVNERFHSQGLTPFIEVVAGAEIMRVPRRLYFLMDKLEESVEEAASLAAQCLFTRSDNGYLRHRALKRLLAQPAPCSAPYIILLCGSYVIEIINDILTAMPGFNQVVFAQFARENRALMELLRAQATSYWNAYYRRQYPLQAQYPGLAVIAALEHWAS
jgi:hypothetical protein